MAVLQMDRLHLVAMKRDRKKLLELLQRRGVVEVSNIQGEDEVFEKADTSQSSAIFQKSGDTARAAMEILEKYAGIKKPSLAFLRGRTGISPQESAAFYAKREQVQRSAGRIVQLQRDITEANADILRAEALQETLVPWLALPVAQNYAGTKKVAVFIGTLEGENTLEDILARLAQAAPQLQPLHVQLVHQGKQQSCILAMALRKDAAIAEEALRAIGFARPAGASNIAPQQYMAQLQEQCENNKKAAAQAQEEIAGYADIYDELRFLEDHMAMRTEKYAVIEKLAQSRHTFVLQGYIPTQDAPALQKELSESFMCSVETMLADAPGDEVPVKLKNNKFAEPTESVLENYSLPGKGEVDPVGVMAIFYYFMFGLMFSDAAYGLIMVAVCGICLAKFKNMEPNWKKSIRMFLWCGVSTAAWGVVFSSYFGDAIQVVAKTFFNYTSTRPDGRIIPPLSQELADNPMALLMFSLAIGLVHLTAGYVMKAITCIRNKDTVGVVFDGIVPIVAWMPLVVILMGSSMFQGMAGFKLTLPPIVNTACLGVAAVAIVCILLMGGRESKNWGKRLLKGLYAVYSIISGWLSDVLSYSRLLALGLATGVIASVMNQMGTMMGGGIVGFIVFLAVFVVGQGLNFAINVLGAYVHSNRLEFVEFFGKFYEGGGRKFEPFGIHTKHYKIIEEDTLK